MSKAQDHGIFHNPGWDFYRAVRDIDDESKEIPEKLISPYFRPVIALICACSCAEGYVHSYAQRIDRTWDVKKHAKEPFKNRLIRAYALISKTPDFSSSPYKELSEMFKWRTYAVHPILQWEERRQNSPIQDIFERIEINFPVKKTRRVIEDFRRKITKDFGLRDTWHRRSVNLLISDLADIESDG